MSVGETRGNVRLFAVLKNGNLRVFTRAFHFCFGLLSESNLS